MTIPANLIINADDFGLDPRISKAIAKGLDEGLINSFSVFPFYDRFHEKLLREVLARHPSVKVGCHLSLISPVASLSAKSRGPHLTESRHHFLRFLARYLIGKYPPHVIYKEWKAQILFLGEFVGGTDRISHLDGHQHLHMLPGVWPVALALQKEFQIPRLRVPYESLTRSVFYRFPFGLCMQALAGLHRWHESARFLGFFSSMRFTLDANQEKLAEIVNHPESRYELMVHPALPDESGDPASASQSILLQPSQMRELDELRKLQDYFRTSPPLVYKSAA